MKLGEGWRDRDSMTDWVTTVKNTQAMYRPAPNCAAKDQRRLVTNYTNRELVTLSKAQVIHWSVFTTQANPSFTMSAPLSFPLRPDNEPFLLLGIRNVHSNKLQHGFRSMKCFLMVGQIKSNKLYLQGRLSQTWCKGSQAYPQYLEC